MWSISCIANNSLESNFSLHFLQVSLWTANLWVFNLLIAVKFLPQSSHLWDSTGLGTGFLAGPGGPGTLEAEDEGPGGTILRVESPDLGPGGPGGPGGPFLVGVLEIFIFLTIAGDDDVEVVTGDTLVVDG